MPLVVPRRGLCTESAHISHGQHSLARSKCKRAPNIAEVACFREKTHDLVRGVQAGTNDLSHLVAFAACKGKPIDKLR